MELGLPKHQEQQPHGNDRDDRGQVPGGGLDAESEGEEKEEEGAVKGEGDDEMGVQGCVGWAGLVESERWACIG